MRRLCRPSTERVALLLLLSATGVLAACRRPDVSGSVLPTEAERSNLPWLRVEVRLLRGTLMDQLSPLAMKHRQEAEAEARQRVLDAAMGERDTTAEAAQRARTALAASGGRTPDTGSARACLPLAESRLAAAQRAYRGALGELAPRLAAVRVQAEEPERTIEELRIAVQSRVATEGRRLRDEYLRTQLVQQSGTVLAAGSRMDRLCWTGENKRDVAMRFRGLTVWYNDRQLPPEVAEQLWRLPPRGQTLRMPGIRGVNNDVLLPGEQYEACFYASTHALPVDLLTKYGLSTENPNRNGDWRVRWDDIELLSETVPVRDAATGQRAADGPPVTAVFAAQLRQFETQAEESHLIEALSNSSGARAVRQAESILIACHQAIEKEKDADEVEHVIRALEEGKTDDFAVEARVRPLLKQVLHDPARLATWMTEVDALLESGTVAQQEQELGAAYHFADVEPGPYTLLANSAIETTQPRVWLIPLQVKGQVAQDLVAATARDVPLRKTLENVLLGENG